MDLIKRIKRRKLRLKKNHGYDIETRIISTGQSGNTREFCLKNP